jgi:hypothetical protein
MFWAQHHNLIFRSTNGSVSWRDVSEPIFYQDFSRLTAWGVLVWCMATRGYKFCLL